MIGVLRQSRGGDSYLQGNLHDCEDRLRQSRGENSYLQGNLHDCKIDFVSLGERIHISKATSMIAKIDYINNNNLGCLEEWTEIGFLEKWTDIGSTRISDGGYVCYLLVCC